MSPTAAPVPRRASVALPVALEGPLSYLVPAHLAQRVLPGVRVLVPLGERRKVGVVVGMEVPPGPARSLKEILEVLDDAPLADAALIEFTRRVSEHYFAPWGQVLQAALPLDLRLRVRRRIRLLEEGREVLEHPFSNPPPGARRVLDILARRGGALQEGGLKRALPQLRGRLTEEMARRGWVAILEESEVPSRHEPREWWAAPSPGRGAGRTRDARRRAALEMLQREGRAVRLDDLASRSGLPVSAIREMGRGGKLLLEARRAAALPDLSLGPAATSPIPTPAQDMAIGAIRAALAEGGFHPFLLEGVTGSGKTEVYLQVALSARSRGLQTLYLVPEIGLTPLLAARIRERFGASLAVLHSGLSEKDRWASLQRIRRGEAWLVLGTRSAVFAPLPHLGLIVVDEEQDPSYYQQESPRYQARDAALVRGKLVGASVVLGSATPSLESVAGERRGRLRPLRLPARVHERPLPEVHLVDMREEFRETGAANLLSRELSAALRGLLDQGDQAMLLLNRRGYATFVLCRACGSTLLCPSCSIALNFHREQGRLMCHYCSRSRGVPRQCPSCGSPHLHFGGAGTQRLEEAIRELEPSLRVGRLDRDAAARGGHARILEQYNRRELDVLVGTQMVAKGHDFPGVTLVGVLSADASLGLPDFRAAERTYQLLTQAAGRAGRGDRPGRVVIQAFAVDHPALLAAARHDPSLFYERELRLRKAAGYPPFAALGLARLESMRAEAASAAALFLARRLRQSAGADVRVLGPAPAPRARLKGAYRMQILVKGKSRATVAATLRQALEGTRGRIGGARVVVEVDPLNLL